MAIRCIVVTPERTELQQDTDFVALPMADGELGLLPGHSPMIGRLGYGVLRLQTATGPEGYFVDGGFAQVEDDVLSVLTARAIPVGRLDAEQAQRDLEEALYLPSHTPEEAQLKQTAVARARGMVRAAK